MNYSIVEFQILYKERCRELIDAGLVHKELSQYANFQDIFSENIFEEILKFNLKRKQRRYRTTKKMEELMKYWAFFKGSKLVFITIDPNNALLGQEERTYKKKIIKWLKRHSYYSILNKDFGDETGREHYHALALINEEVEALFHQDGTPKRSSKGYPLYELKNKDFAKIVKVKNNDDLQFEPTINLIDPQDKRQMVNYLLKLNNHSNKESTKASRISIIKSSIMKNYKIIDCH